jgi:dolichol-phosphate mannosyltransferase
LQGGGLTVRRASAAAARHNLSPKVMNSWRLSFGRYTSRVSPLVAEEKRFRLSFRGLYGTFGAHMRSETLVIVPTFNERENLPQIAERLMTLPVAVEMLVVDDNSPDGTGRLADELALTNSRIHVMHRREKEGLGRAYCAGFNWALENGFEFIFEMDGDLSHNPSDIPIFLDAAKDADLVLGSRYSNGIRVINWPLNRLMLSLMAAQYVRVITGMPFTDPTGGFKCFRRKTLQSIDLENVRSNGYSFQIEMTHKIWRKGMRILEVPIIFTDRFQGRSKMSGKIVEEALLMVWRLLAQNSFRRKVVRREPEF